MEVWWFSQEEDMSAFISLSHPVPHRLLSIRGLPASFIIKLPTHNQLFIQNVSLLMIILLLWIIDAKYSPHFGLPPPLLSPSLSSKYLINLHLVSEVPIETGGCQTLMVVWDTSHDGGGEIVRVSVANEHVQQVYTVFVFRLKCKVSDG